MQMHNILTLKCADADAYHLGSDEGVRAEALSVYVKEEQCADYIKENNCGDHLT